MTRKLSIIIFILSGFVSCTKNIPDCPSKMCVMSGGWILAEAYIDEVKETIDLGKYALVLNQPSPLASTTSNFNRVQVSGSQDSGSWSLENGEKILRLIPDNIQFAAEDWVIESFTPRQLVLVVIRDSSKEGPSKIRLVLEPF